MLVPLDTVGEEVFIHSHCHLVGGPGAPLHKQIVTVIGYTHYTQSWEGRRTTEEHTTTQVLHCALHITNSVTGGLFIHACTNACFSNCEDIVMTEMHSPDAYTIFKRGQFTQITQKHSIQVVIKPHG